MDLKPLTLPQHPNHNIHPCSPNHNNIHPCSPNAPTLHTAINTPLPPTPTPTTTSQPNYLDPEGTCDVRGNGSGSNNCSGSGSGGANDGKTTNLNTLLFSVGRNDAAEEEEKKTSAPRRTKEEMRRRKDLVQQARSHRLKVGSESTAKIQKMLWKEKRTQPRMKDILLRQMEKQKKKEEDDNEEEKEQKKEVEEGKEEVIASREGGMMAKPNISDAEEEIMERRDGHCLEPGEEGGGGTPFPIPNPISVKPNASKGGNESRRRWEAFDFGSWETDPGPNSQQRQAKPKPGRTSEEGVPTV